LVHAQSVRLAVPYISLYDTAYIRFIRYCALANGMNPYFQFIAAVLQHLAVNLRLNIRKRDGLPYIYGASKISRAFSYEAAHENAQRHRDNFLSRYDELA
jgi:hypothetical protein